MGKPKYFQKIHDNKDMKKFNLKLHTSFLFTILILQGCMPDSLTKFKKDAPKKTTAASTSTPTVPPVTDSSGNTVPFVAPTKFFFVSETAPTATEQVGIAMSRGATIDGTMSDSTLRDKFFERCDLDITGNTQTQTLPSGTTLNVSTCTISGTPLAITTVSTAFCSDPTYVTQGTCEAAAYTWNATTSKCSNPDYQYATQAACLAGRNKWYKVGSAVPYRIVLKYHNSAGAQSTMSTTVNIGVYKAPTALRYTQSDKVILKAAAASGYSLADIVPVVTTTASSGAYAKENVISSLEGASGIAKIVDTTLNKIGVNKYVPLYVTDTAPFTVGGFVAVVGTCSNATYTSRASCIGAGAVWTGTGIVGKVASIDSTYDLIYVENISTGNKYFRTNDRLSNDANGYAQAAIVTDVENTYSFIDDTNIDNDSQFYTGRYKIGEMVNVYETGVSYTIRPMEPFSATDDSISVANAVTYKISPALPPTLSFNTDTGIITGHFASDFTHSQFTVTATNPLGKTTTSFKISSVTSPSDYSITNRQIITVNSTAAFKEGETLYQPIQPPLAEALNAKILKILNSYQLAIQTFNGVFVPGASLDNNSSTYKAEKAYIIPYSSCVNPTYTTQTTCEGAGYVWAPSSAIHYNLAITTNNSGAYVAGNYINSTAGTGSGARGLVKFVQTGVKDVLYVQYLTQTATSVAAAKTFYEADTLDSGLATVDQVETETFKVTLTAPGSFVKGSDVVTSGNVSGYTYDKSGSTIFVNELAKIASGTLFKVGQTIYNDETVTAAASTTISAVSHDNYIIFERGKKMIFNGNLNTGVNGIIYSVTPALPAGLTLDTQTGIISGTATASTPKKDFLITASNFIGSTTFVVGLEVKDYFEINETSGAPSFRLHKVGDNAVNRRCRIDSADISSQANSKALDIRCFLDGEEQDLHQSEIKFSFDAGPGICEYIQYDPYYFQAWSPAQTTDISTKYTSMIIQRNGCSTLSSTGTIPTADMCEGNYTSYDAAYPNCDEGRLAYWAETYSENAGVCTLTARTKTYVNCGGKRANCISGPIKDIFDTTKLAAGNRGVISSAISGLKLKYTHTSPQSHGDGYITVRNSNGMINNQCYSSAADSTTWENTSNTFNTAANGFFSTPFNSDSNPFYTITCRDSAYDIKARIRVIVRDWDRAFRIDSGVDNQNYAAPSAYMNNAGNDPIFNSPYNDYADWDDNYYGGASQFTGGSCGAHDAGSCNVSMFETSAQCAAVGGTVTVAGSCSAGGFTTRVTCEAAGNTWTDTTCTFNNQYQCELYGGTWPVASDEDIKFPMNFLGP